MVKLLQEVGIALFYSKAVIHKRFACVMVFLVENPRAAMPSGKNGQVSQPSSAEAFACATFIFLKRPKTKLEENTI